MSTLLRLGVLAVFVASAVVVPATAAKGHFCAPVDPRTKVLEADVAFVGVVKGPDPDRSYYTIPARTPDSVGPRPAPADLHLPRRSFAVVRIDVEQDLTGTLDDEIEIWTPSDEGWAVPTDPGTRVGLVARLHDGYLIATRCDIVHPAVLPRAAAPLADPDGSAPAAFIVGGSFGEARTIAYDARGTTRAYGIGEGTTIAVAVCPGSRMMAEAAMVRGQTRLAVEVAVRTLPDLDLAWTVNLPWPVRNGWESIRDLSCRDHDGHRLLGLMVDPQANRPTVRLFAIEGGQLRTVWTGAGRTGVLDTDYAYVGTRLDGRDVTQIDLQTVGVEELSGVPGRLADLDTARRYGPRLAHEHTEHVTSAAQLQATAGAVLDGRLWGLVSVQEHDESGRQGRSWTSVRRVDVPNGEPVEVARLDSPVVHAIVPVPPPDHVAASGVAALAWPPAGAGPSGWPEGIGLRAGIALVTVALMLGIAWVTRRRGVGVP